MAYAFEIVASPVGALKLAASETALVAILWEHDRPGRVRLEGLVEGRDHPILDQAARQLADYFAGDLEGFALPLAMAGTPFQKSVWEALLSIPFGETRTYREMADRIGNPKATRAVGAAIGRNPSRSSSRAIASLGRTAR